MISGRASERKGFREGSRPPPPQSQKKETAMSRHAAAKQSKQVAEETPSWSFTLHITSSNPMLGILNDGVTFNVTEPQEPLASVDGELPLTGYVEMVSPTPNIVFTGFYDSGRVTFTLTLAGVTYTFDGVASSSGDTMAGLITAFSLLEDGPGADEDQGSWSAQARGGGQEVPEKEKAAAHKEGK
jgi:hypothetical protein